MDAWKIDVCPAFEHYIEPHDIDKLEHEAAGIYRYRNERGEIIYIGSGKIRDRFEAPEREKWRIVRIEYSIVTDRQRAYQWERYWHDQFEGEFGRLPAYNLAIAPDIDAST